MLSTTAKSKARMARKKAKEDAVSGMDVDEEDGAAAEGKNDKENEAESKEKEGGDKMDVDGVKETEEKKPKKRREPEPTSFSLSDPSRITTAQAEVCAFNLDQRYRPIRPEERPCGVIMVTDSKPEEGGGRGYGSGKGAIPRRRR